MGFGDATKSVFLISLWILNDLRERKIRDGSTKKSEVIENSKSGKVKSEMTWMMMSSNHKQMDLSDDALSVTSEERKLDESTVNMPADATDLDADKVDLIPKQKEGAKP